MLDLSLIGGSLKTQQLVEIPPLPLAFSHPDGSPNTLKQ